MLSRKGRDISYLARAVIRDVAVLPVRECILDGELIAVGSDGRPNFEAMGSRRHPHWLCAFDLFVMHGEDLRPLPLAERQRRLAALLRRVSPCLHAVDGFDDPIRLLKAAAEAGPRIVSKRPPHPLQ